MAQSGMFRTAMRGFHKDDVLQYIDELTTRTTTEQQAATDEIARRQQEVSELRVQLDELTETLKQSEENAQELQRLVDQYRATVREMGELSAQVDNLNRDRLELNSRCVHAEKAIEEQTTQLTQAQAALAAAQAENLALRDELESERLTELQKEQFVQMEESYRRATAENRRYRALIGHVGTFVAEVRQMNQGILDTASRRGTEAVEAADARLAALEAQVAQSRRELLSLKGELCDRKAAVDTRLTAMMEQLEQDAVPEDAGAAE